MQHIVTASAASVPSVNPPAALDPAGWISEHPIAATIIVALWLWVSLCLIIHMWMTRTDAPAFKKVRWSLLILVPIVGWTVYPACFERLSPIDTPCANGGGFT